jgi:NADH dehydrogenase
MFFAWKMTGESRNRIARATGGNGMSVLVTGAGGFVGNNVVRQLVAQGRPVRAMVRGIDKAKMRLSDVASQVEFVEGDVTKRGSLDAHMRDVSAIVHTVAIALERGGQTYEEVNFQGTVNLVDAAERAGVRRFINVSQNGARPDHFSRFLRSKGKAQEYVASSKLEWTAIRPSAIFGPQDEFFNTFARLIRLTPIIFPLIGGGTAQFQPVSIDDVTDSITRSLDDNGAIGKEFEIGGPEILTLGEIEKRILAAMGEKRAMINAPVGLLRPAVFVMEKTLPGTPVSLTLLELLKEPNVVRDNALITYFKMQPRPFAGDNLTYLREADAGSAIKKFLTGAAVN